MLTPDIISSGLGLISGFLGPKASYSPEQQRQRQIADQLQAYANGVPGSDPGEQAANAGMLAQLRGQQAQQREGFYGTLGGPGRLDQAQMLDQRQNLNNADQGQLLQAQMMQMVQNLNARRQALLQAAQVSQGVGPKGQSGGGVGQAFANLAYMYGQQAAMKRYQQANQQPGGAVVPPTGIGGPLGGFGAQPNLGTITGQGGDVHQAYNPMSGIMMPGPSQDTMPVFGGGQQQAPAGMSGGVPGGNPPWVNQALELQPPSGGWASQVLGMSQGMPQPTGVPGAGQIMGSYLADQGLGQRGGLGTPPVGSNVGQLLQTRTPPASPGKMPSLQRRYNRTVPR